MSSARARAPSAAHATPAFAVQIGSQIHIAAKRFRQCRGCSRDRFRAPLKFRANRRAYRRRRWQAKLALLIVQVCNGALNCVGFGAQPHYNGAIILDCFAGYRRGIAEDCGETGINCRPL